MEKYNCKSSQGKKKYNKLVSRSKSVTYNQSTPNVQSSLSVYIFYFLLIFLLVHEFILVDTTYFLVFHPISVDPPFPSSTPGKTSKQFGSKLLTHNLIHGWYVTTKVSTPYLLHLDHFFSNVCKPCVGLRKSDKENEPTGPQISTSRSRLDRRCRQKITLNPTDRKVL